MSDYILLWVLNWTLVQNFNNLMRIEPSLYLRVGELSFRTSAMTDTED